MSSRHTYHHQAYEGGVHWFSADSGEGEEIAHAHVLEREGPGGPHIEIRELKTNRHHRRHGVGSQLLKNVEDYFPGRELRLKPYPIDGTNGPDEAELREFYENCGFEPRPLRGGDPWTLYAWMHKQTADGAAAAAPSAVLDMNFPAGPVTVPPPPKPSRPASQRPRAKSLPQGQSATKARR